MSKVTKEQLHEAVAILTEAAVNALPNLPKAVQGAMSVIALEATGAKVPADVLAEAMEFADRMKNVLQALAIEDDECDEPDCDKTMWGMQ